MLNASWGYVLVEAGPEEAGAWRRGGWGEDLPDLMFPSDRTWLFSTLWDDDWSCVGGSRSFGRGPVPQDERDLFPRELEVRGEGVAGSRVG
jgi:hypothetical protein